MSLIIGAIAMYVGFMFVWKTEWFLHNFGRIDFFEKHLGVEGGSRLGYKLVGFLVIFFGVIIFFGMYNDFMGWILEPLMKYNL